MRGELGEGHENLMDVKNLRPEFWRKFPMTELSHEEWEALCDGCGRCCMLKLEDEDTGEIAYTDIHCRLYDPDTCRCGNYALRRQLVKGCVQLTPDTIEEDKEWMPATCAYRLLAEGRDLYQWHPLISGRAESVDEAGISMRQKSVPEYEIDEEDYEDRIIEGMV
jgi:uncharacterized cysteine cluster protein YcgN (CxxCxxCC family)